MAWRERGDPVFDAFYASQIQYQNDSVITQTLNQNAGAALLDLIGPSILVTHSQSGPIGFLIADVRPSLVRALVNLEPMGPPFEEAVFNSGSHTRPYGLTTIPLSYSPPIDNVTTDLATVKVPSTNPERSDCLLQASSTPRKLRNLAKVPMLLVTSEASYHTVYDYCTVRYLRQGGVDVEHLELSREGIHGNGHMFFLEKNNLAIAARLERWIQKFSSPIANSTASTRK
ncbi:hypothetical protein MMC22_007910 [Lobaria immixta]|nr:hypothetical protein [Lobaria immixta]